MWRNYLTVGVRALAKNRTYAFINIVGLAIGLAACLMILLYVRYERSYDEWLPNSENVYQIQSQFTDPDTGEVVDMQMSSYVSGTALKKDFPEIERAVYVLNGGSTVVMRDGEAVATEDAVLVDNLFFDVLQFPLVEGDPATALARPGTMVLSETEARRQFGGQPALGRTVTVIDRGNAVDHRVTGIMKDLPKNSHMRLNMVIRMDPVSRFAENPDFMTQWGWNSGWNYFALRPGADIGKIRAGLPAWEKRNIPDQQFGDQSVNQGEFLDFNLTAIPDVHLGVARDGAMTPGNDSTSLFTFAVIAVLILAMACVNFTNLATARASQRAREVALRKVLGATRRQLMTQFITESVMVASVAMLIALAMTELFLPVLSGFLDADLRITYFGEGSVLLPIVLLVLLVGAAGGAYPAFYLSRFQPAQVLKANKSTAEAAGSGRFRNALVVGQFAVSIGLIICTAIVYSQTVYARTADPGYNRDGLIQVSGIGRRQLADKAEAIAREVARIDGVAAVGRTGIGVATDNQTNTIVQVPGRQEPVGIGAYQIDDGFFDAMGMKMIGGRGLSFDRPMDDVTLPFPADPAAEQALVTRGANVVANELATKRLGFANPKDAVGAQLRMGMVSPDSGLVPITIVGVVKDTRFRSIREPVEPIIYSLANAGQNWMVVRTDGRADPAAVREGIEGVWKRFASDAPFQAEFSEDVVAELYASEEARAQAFAGFALLAVIVACLGLFGLAAFTAERRTKEIGIRKVLGARSRDIVRLLAWQFSKPVIVANLIAWPAAWWVMRDWLNGFDTRIGLGPTPFLLAGFLALAIALGTIAGHALRVARSNPIAALRYE